MARGIDITELSGNDLIELMEMVCEQLNVLELIKLEEMAQAKRQEKLDDAKQAVIDEMRSKLEQMGVDATRVNVSFGGERRRRRDSGQQAPIKYRTPDGYTWSGRGRVPTWLQVLEAEGHNREEFRVEE